MTLLSLLFGLYVFENPITRGWEEYLLDRFISIRDLKSRPQSQDATIIIVDEEAIRTEFGYYDPIPRRYLARLIDSLSLYHPALIALDVALMDRFPLDPPGDSLLAETLSGHQNVISIALFEEQEDGTQRVKWPDSLFGNNLVGVGHAMLQTFRGSGVFAQTRSLTPIIETADAQKLPAFSILAYRLFRQVRSGTSLPLEKIETELSLYRGGMLINFWGPPAHWQQTADGRLSQYSPGAIPTFRSSLVTGSTHLPEHLLRDKVIFIGSGSEYSRDQFLTPYYGMLHDYRLMRGAEVHAHAFLTLLHRRFISRPSKSILAVVMTLLSALLIYLVLYCSVRRHLAVFFFMPILVWSGSFLLFVTNHFWMPVLAVSAAMMMSYAVAAIYQALLSSYQRRRANILSHYWLEDVIGNGGMGTVYLAKDLNSQKQVAVKVLNPALWGNPENRGRFANEGRILSEINHPNVVRVLETGETTKGGFIAMEYLPGPTLKHFIRKHHPLEIEQILRLAIQIAGGLTAVHARNIIHRDLSSANLMFDVSGNLRIMDFGLSKSPLVTAVTAQGSIVGTLGYTAPEQITGMEVDHRCDIFSMGVIFYEMATGELPFTGENEMAIIHALFNNVPSPPRQLRGDLPPELEKIILVCLEKSAGKRWRNAREVLSALGKITLA